MAKHFRSESVFICRPTALSTVRPNSVFSLSQCLQTMKFKHFWTPHLPVVLMHIKLSLLWSSQNLLLNPVPSALHAWLIAMVQLPTQPKSLSFWPFHSQEPSSADGSSYLEHCQDGHKANVDCCPKWRSSPCYPLLQAPFTSTVQCLGCPRRSEPKIKDLAVAYLPMVNRWQGNKHIIWNNTFYAQSLCRPTQHWQA